MTRTGYHKRPSTLTGELTPRERDLVAALFAGATTYKALAEALTVTDATIGSHLLRIFRKTGTTGLISLVLWGVRNGYYKEQSA